MKRLLIAFAVLFSVVFVSSCNKYRTSPTTVVDRYVECLRDQNYDGIIKLFYFESSKQKSENYDKLVEVFKTKIEPRITAKGGIASYKLKEEHFSKDGLTAYVELSIEYGDSTVLLQDTEVLNKGGKWYLNPGLR